VHEHFLLILSCGTSFHSWWYLKLKALIEIRDWEQLEQFAKSKKSPIGFEPFVEHLLVSGNQRQAVRYVPRCESKNRADMYVKAGEWVKAAEGERRVNPGS
jgi:hypothetical protein